MTIQPLLTELEDFLTATFAAVDAWFDQPATLLTFPPADQGWTGSEILTHIGLTNHYLLILIEKGTSKALLNTQSRDLASELASLQSPQARLAAIGVLHAFPWVRPDHMEPRDHPRPLPLVRQQLREQLAQALACLHRLPNCEGVLYQTTMSVNDLGKLNVYEYMYFLGQHAQRHVEQLKENATEYVVTTEQS
jgi:hypothetical protein